MRDSQASHRVVNFRGGSWHRAGNRRNLGELFQDLERRPTMARTNDARSVEEVLAARGGMQGL